jgi:hypothetical protein
MNKQQRFLVIALGSSIPLGLLHVHLKPVLDPFTRYLVYFAAAKITSDVIYYLLQPGRNVWVYPEDYLFNELFTLAMYGLPVCVLQRYLIAYQMLRFPVVVAIVDSFVPVLLLCLTSRWKQEDEDDRSYRPGRRLLDR